jgi:hypothetical protein
MKPKGNRKMLQQFRASLPHLGYLHRVIAMLLLSTLLFAPLTPAANAQTDTYVIDLTRVHLHTESDDWNDFWGNDDDEFYILLAAVNIKNWTVSVGRSYTTPGMTTQTSHYQVAPFFRASQTTMMQDTVYLAAAVEHDEGDSEELRKDVRGYMDYEMQSYRNGGLDGTTREEKVIALKRDMYDGLQRYKGTEDPQGGIEELKFTSQNFYDARMHKIVTQEVAFLETPVWPRYTAFFELTHAPYVRVCDGTSFSGTCVKYYTGTNISQLPASIDNKVSSVQIEGGAKVALYENPNFNRKSGGLILDGACQFITAHTYSLPTNPEGIPNNSASSLKVGVASCY